MRPPAPRCRSGSFRRFSVGLLLLLVAVGGAAADEYRPRGFVPPPDYERILAEHHELIPLNKDPLPPSYDWRAFDGTTPVQDQSSCGSCWAFAAAGEMESKIKIYYGLTLNLSEQQIVSCNPYNAGCQGGWAGAAYYVFMHYGGVLENCMPYESSDLVHCTQDDYLKFTDMDTWVSIDNDIDQIKTAVLNNGPVCTAVDANSAWDGYTGGVIDAPGSGTNHLVLIVGWSDSMGDNGAWIVKNSWGAGWGVAGYCYVAYGACNIGWSVTSMTYTPPPVSVSVASPEPDVVYYSDNYVTIDWATHDEAVETVDLYYGTRGACQENLIAADVPNTGSYEWFLPNVTTDRGTVLVFPSEGTHRGFGFSEGEFTIIGHQTRYVSDLGSNTPPFDTPAKAAHSIVDAVLAGAGQDTVLIAGGDYLESNITLNSQCHLEGGWSADFSEHDPTIYPTRLRGVTGTMRFNADAADFCGVRDITFHDCLGATGSVPVNGRHGGAIISVNSSPQIVNCIFENNRANPNTTTGWGGAILSHGGTPVIRNCTFTGNIGSHGGAIALSECNDAIVADCDFFANATSDSTASYFGAAVYVSGGAAMLADCELRGGGAGLGGALAIADGATVTASGLTVADNRSIDNGAGIHATDSALHLSRSAVVGNRSWSGFGGGLYVRDGALSLINVAVLDNSASGLGGGLFGQGITGGAIGNVLLHDNVGSDGGGAFLLASGPLDFYNNVITANTGGGFWGSGAEMVSTCNLAFGNVGGDFLNDPGATDLVVDPLFTDVAALDFVPAVHSPLIDSGTNAAGDDWDGSHTDRGLHGGPEAAPTGPGRVVDFGGVIDGDQVDLTWSACPDAVSYVVYRDDSETFTPSPGLVCQIVAAPATQCTETLPEGDCYYLVGAVDAAGHAGGFSERFDTGGTVPVADAGLPRALAISSVAPNPFNPRTTVGFAVPRTGVVRLQVFDLRGRLVRTLHEGALEAGYHAVVWNGADRQDRQVAAGVYFVRLDDGRRDVTTKAVLAK